MVGYRILTNGLIEQWGTVANTSGSSSWLTQKNLITYSNTEYKIFLQGRFSRSADDYAIVNITNITSDSFQYFWSDATNYLNYYTIGY